MSRHDGLDGVREFARRRQRLNHAVAHEPGSDLSRGGLFAVFTENPLELIPAQRVHEIGGSDRAIRIEPHVERSIVLKTEPARSRVELVRRDAEIKQCSVDFPDPD